MMKCSINLMNFHLYNHLWNFSKQTFSLEEVNPKKKAFIRFGAIICDHQILFVFYIEPNCPGRHSLLNIDLNH